MSTLHISFSHNPEIIKNMAMLFLACSLLVSSLFLLCNFSANAMAQFLQVTKPLSDAEVLLVEGWLPERLLGYVKEEFLAGSYRYILVSGMDSASVSDPDQEQKIYRNAGHLAHELINMGIDSSKIKVVTCSSATTHKTFSMAVAVRKWFSVNDPAIRRINIISAWSHGRKSWCTYQRILGDFIKTGIITYPKRQLPIVNWWLTRSGFSYQVYALTGYIYAAVWPIARLDTGG